MHRIHIGYVWLGLVWQAKRFRIMPQIMS